MAKPKLMQQVFEGRYERGYRYLDRCGEAMLILEELLPSETGKTWMPDQVAPTGAKLKCPELDMNVGFDSYHLVVEQDPVDSSDDLPEVVALVYATISARFDLRIFSRLGFRRFFMIGVDSVEQAEDLSARKSPISPTWPYGPTGMTVKSCEAVNSFETDDGSKGIRFSVKPSSKVEAPLQIDDRVLSPSRQWSGNQKKVLIDQIKRQRLREQSPVSGLLIDIDYYVSKPPKVDIKEFIQEATRQGTDMLASFAKPAGSVT